MGRMRSPNFPSLTLEEALTAAKVIWDKNRKAPIPREAAAKDLGYAGLTGRSMTVLGALNQYGLIEITAKGQTRVTQTGEDIFIGYPESVRRAAVTRAGRSPGLFRDIYEKYEGDIPGENAIRSFLFQNGFTNEGVEKAIKSFAATNRYVEIYGESESYGNGLESSAQTAPDQPIQEEKVVATAAPPAPSQGQGIDPLFWNKGALDYNLSSSGLVLVGKTNSASELRAFIEKLKALTVLLPDAPKDEKSDET